MSSRLSRITPPARLSFVASALVLAACASGGSRPVLSGAVRDVAGVSCEEERIQVVDTREREGDTVYVLDACGKRVEIAQGLAVPARKSEVTTISAENPFERPPNVTREMPREKTNAVREKVQGWCMRKGEGPVDPEAFAFYHSTDAELAECRERLAKLLEPIGTDRDEETGQETYWFMVGQYLFTATEVLYDPSDARATRRSRVEEGPEEAHARQARKDRSGRFWFGRIELGSGFVAHRTFTGGSIDIRTELGVKVAPDVGFGLVAGPHWAIFGDGERKSRISEIGVVLPFYPIAGEGLRIDASGGLALLSYDFLGADETGPLIGAGIGYDFGARARKVKDDGWSGFGLTLRGFYASPGGYATVAGILEGGGYAW
jgi:hypothetical protein